MLNLERLRIFCVSQPLHFMRYVWKTLHYVWWCNFLCLHGLHKNTKKPARERIYVAQKYTQTHTSSMVLCSLPGSQILTHKTYVFHSNVNAMCKNERRILDNLVFQNEKIFVQLDELDKLDRITQAWIGFNYSLTQTQKTF